MSKNGQLTNEEKAREGRVRRLAFKKGYSLHRERIRSPQMPGYGRYYLHHEQDRRFVSGLTLDQAEGYLRNQRMTLLEAIEVVRACITSLHGGNFKYEACDDRDTDNGCLGHVRGYDKKQYGSLVYCDRPSCGCLHVTIWDENNQVIYTDDPHPLPDMRQRARHARPRTLGALNGPKDLAANRRRYARGEHHGAAS